MTDSTPAVSDLRALLEKATPGPWKAMQSKWEPTRFIVQAGMPSNRVLVSLDGDGAGYDSLDKANAKLIAAAVNALPDLLAHLSRLEEQLAQEKARLDYIERTFSGMTNRERYLPVQMIWGKGCNGRSLREACDKYMKRDAAMSGGTGE